jgi:hypothetical protein
MYMAPVMSRSDGSEFLREFKRMQTNLNVEAAGYTFVSYVKLKSGSVQPEPCLEQITLSGGIDKIVGKVSA